jgi:hypothetical protein
MTECIHYCDRCQARIEVDCTLLVMECGPAPPPWPIDIARGRPTIDLCGPCLSALVEWLGAPDRMPVESSPPRGSDRPLSSG